MLYQIPVPVFHIELAPMDVIILFLLIFLVVLGLLSYYSVRKPR